MIKVGLRFVIHKSSALNGILMHLMVSTNTVRVFVSVKMVYGLLYANRSPVRKRAIDCRFIKIYLTPS